MQSRQSHSGPRTASRDEAAESPIVNLAIMKAVEAGMGVLGDSGRTATFYFIELNAGLKRSQIPANPDVLVTALRTIFGLGSKELMMSIVKALQLVRLEGDNKPVHKFISSIEAGIRSVESGVA